VKLAALQAVLDTEKLWSIAVSGGIDSMTLATIAHQYLPHKPQMYHATSPAVSKRETDRIRNHAALEKWNLTVIDAGEFEDEKYRSNPINRCYFCKAHLYESIFRAISKSNRQIASGTNLDDQNDFRPGLQAARQFSVRHPLVDAEIDKEGVRDLARYLGLSFSELPAQPCLSSRVETGIRIESRDLQFIDKVESLLRAQSSGQSIIRVRLKRGGILVETDCDKSNWPELGELASRQSKESGYKFLGIREYRRGSSFVGK